MDPTDTNNSNPWAVEPDLQEPGALSGSILGNVAPDANPPEPRPPRDTEVAEHVAQAQLLNGDEFIPVVPSSLDDTGLSESDIEALVLKQLLTHGSRTGREISGRLRLPLSLVSRIMSSLKNQMCVGYKSNALAGDYEYELSPSGSEKANVYMSQCTYCGAAPVGLDEYRKSVFRQTIKNNTPTLESLRGAYSDLVLSTSAMAQIGQAIASGRSLFLYGPPGNGKTSMAERAMHALGESIWVPRSLAIGGQIVRFFDPNCHEELPLNAPETAVPVVDHRWVRIRRPTIVVGGELDLEHLQLTTNPITGISEAPVQLKSNCGCLVIDDFGRQQIGVSELLNRWIIPLEKGYDVIKLPTGSNVRMPFEQMVIFSTNLVPAELCDEAFLRRIPYKIEVNGPDEDQFREVFRQRAQRFGMTYDPGVVDYLLEQHFRNPNRAVRFCHAEDLLELVRDYCRFNNQPLKITQNHIDIAAKNYFAAI